MDIYGFECFAYNSLEQLCINYANEKLQQHFVKHFLKEIQDEYANEALPWTEVTYSDNTECVNLLESNPGIFAILNEVSWTYLKIIILVGRQNMHWPGIEPGPPAWQASILPLNHQCFTSFIGNVSNHILLNCFVRNVS